MPGEHIALVGRSGAGKTTLATLLLRFFDPQDGEIRVNGIPLREIPVEEWRRQIAWAPQNPSLWHDRLAANLRLGPPGCG